MNQKALFVMSSLIHANAVLLAAWLITQYLQYELIIFKVNIFFYQVIIT